MATSSELRDLDPESLQERLAETKEELFNMRFQDATGQLDNYRRLRDLRKDVARIKTEMRARELREAEESEG